jgi:transcriptional regulator with XRE-family HTH domain
MINSSNESRFTGVEREFLSLTLARQIFGALYSALKYRKESHDLTRAEFGERIGRDKTGVSKLLRGPGNWTIQTISDIANALEVDVEFAFFDQHDQSIMFTATGMHHSPSLVQNYSVIASPTRNSEYPIAATGNVSISIISTDSNTTQPIGITYYSGTTTFNAGSNLEINPDIHVGTVSSTVYVSDINTSGAVLTSLFGDAND